jgi:transcriptional regulator with XRE-family HTH domain
MRCVGLSVRALRRRRRLTQERLAAMVGVSRSTIVRVERGHAESATVRTLMRIAGALGTTISVRILWQGEGLDRLLDAAHADLTETVLRLLRDSGWEVATEVSFNVRGERGTIDILAFHRPTESLLVIEIKSVVPDLQAMLGTIDRKVRLAVGIARERGWRVDTVSRLLVLPTTALLVVESIGTRRLSRSPCHRERQQCAGGSGHRSERLPGSYF